MYRANFLRKLPPFFHRVHLPLTPYLSLSLSVSFSLSLNPTFPTAFHNGVSILLASCTIITGWVVGLVGLAEWSIDPRPTRAAQELFRRKIEPRPISTFNKLPRRSRLLEQLDERNFLAANCRPRNPDANNVREASWPRLNEILNLQSPSLYSRVCLVNVFSYALDVYDDTVGFDEGALEIYNFASIWWFKKEILKLEYQCEKFLGKIMKALMWINVSSNWSFEVICELHLKFLVSNLWNVIRCYVI